MRCTPVSYTHLPGLQLSEAYQLADKIDDLFESKLDYAFDERIGYITACPTNVGTGLRVSIMVHLPALVATGQVKAVQMCIRDSFRGVLRDFTCKPILAVSGFSRIVLDEVCRIPFGVTASYRDIARAIGMPTASRLSLIHI